MRPRWISQPVTGNLAFCLAWSLIRVLHIVCEYKPGAADSEISYSHIHSSLLQQMRGTTLAQAYLAVAPVCLRSPAWPLAIFLFHLPCYFITYYPVLWEKKLYFYVTLWDIHSFILCWGFLLDNGQLRLLFNKVE